VVGRGVIAPQISGCEVKRIEQAEFENVVVEIALPLRIARFVHENEVCAHLRRFEGTMRCRRV
jgi:hypothetical protein